ncbi:acetylcholinesterase-like [Dreissena polymorpha]|uniref:Carboxylesterase type B domain-containing protein n=1 Tax=Dreissena polymorpha TaxID=45954 RepID=A0A9D4CF27_DREPO|nr:acetylcholinesterase-like [Dreissena polymorpha]KAH3723737.1 hypothetical protein DPMN_049531 [Dreissena polymorpha]
MSKDNIKGFILNNNLCLIQLWITFIVTCSIQFASCELIIVQTALGNISGSIEEVTSYDDTGNPSVMFFAQYLSIPYAEPPIRFRRPEPKTPWAGEYNGTYYRPACYLHGDPARVGTFDVKTVMMSEDCLTLDIYAPNSTIVNQSSLPVLVFLYSSPGYSSAFAADVLCTVGDVVVVVINFRQGMLGFFSLGSEAAPGNYGLFDQQMALQWIAKYIHSFGGDPKKVTLVGHSFGASNAIYHTLYPGNRGLIHRVVSLSGTALPPSGGKSYVRNSIEPYVLEEIGCQRASDAEIMSCLRGKSLTDILNALDEKSFTFRPSVDGTFLRSDPEVMMTDQAKVDNYTEELGFLNVDLLLGLNNMEGGTHVALLWAERLNTTDNEFNVSRADIRKILVPMVINLTYGSNISQSITQTVNFHYNDFTGADDPQRLRQRVVDLFTDVDVAAPLVRTANLHASLGQGSTYLYQFSEPLNLTQAPVWLSGANRANDVHFLFGFSERGLQFVNHVTGFTPTVEQRALSTKLIKMIAHFAITGNPNPLNAAGDPQWPEYDAMSMTYLDISAAHVTPKHHFREPFMTFWTSVVPELLTATSQNATSPLVCPEEIGHIIKVNLVSAENIIIALSIVSFCLLCACVLLVCLSVAREPTLYSNSKYAVMKTPNLSETPSISGPSDS